MFIRRPSARSRDRRVSRRARRRGVPPSPAGGSSCQRRRTMTAARGHGGATRPTETGRDREAGDPAGSPLGTRNRLVASRPVWVWPELRICGRRFDSSRGHSVFVRTPRHERPRTSRGGHESEYHHEHSARSSPLSLHRFGRDRYVILDPRTSPDHPLGDAIETFIRREDAERFVEEVRGDEPELARLAADRGARGGRAELTTRYSRDSIWD